jgi:hypothetical protein
MLIGVVGALLGGFLGGLLFDVNPVDEFWSLSTWLAAVVRARLTAPPAWIARATAAARTSSGASKMATRSYSPKLKPPTINLPPIASTAGLVAVSSRSSGFLI